MNIAEIWCRIAHSHKGFRYSPLGDVGAALYECKTCGVKWAESWDGLTLPYRLVADFYSAIPAPQAPPQRFGDGKKEGIGE